MRMVFNWFKLRSRAYLLIICVGLVLLIISEAKASNKIFNESRKTIVIDPGHGGHDTGTQGPNGTFEKTAALNLTRIIATELENRYQIFFTRTDDYLLDIYSRTALANQVGADLFISIHTGGSYLHNASGITIFYYKRKSESMLPTQIITTKNYTTWDYVQVKHIAKSSILSKLIQNRILEQVMSLDCKIKSAPLLVLKGADMPAILIEIGYLTNPVEEKKLNDPNILSNLAKAISKGINDFFYNKQ